MNRITALLAVGLLVPLTVIPEVEAQKANPTLQCILDSVSVTTRESCLEVPDLDECAGLNARTCDQIAEAVNCSSNDDCIEIGDPCERQPVICVLVNFLGECSDYRDCVDPPPVCSEGGYQECVDQVCDLLPNGRCNTDPCFSAALVCATVATVVACAEDPDCPDVPEPCSLATLACALIVFIVACAGDPDCPDLPETCLDDGWQECRDIVCAATPDGICQGDPCPSAQVVCTVVEVIQACVDDPDCPQVDPCATVPCDPPGCLAGGVQQCIDEVCSTVSCAVPDCIANADLVACWTDLCEGLDDRIECDPTGLLCVIDQAFFLPSGVTHDPDTAPLRFVVHRDDYRFHACGLDGPTPGPDLVVDLSPEDTDCEARTLVTLEAPVGAPEDRDGDSRYQVWVSDLTVRLEDDCTITTTRGPESQLLPHEDDTASDGGLCLLAGQGADGPGVPVVEDQDADGVPSIQARQGRWTFTTSCTLTYANQSTEALGPDPDDSDPENPVGDSWADTVCFLLNEEPSPCRLVTQDVLWPCQVTDRDGDRVPEIQVCQAEAQVWSDGQVALVGDRVVMTLGDGNDREVCDPVPCRFGLTDDTQGSDPDDRNETHEFEAEPLSPWWAMFWNDEAAGLLWVWIAIGAIALYAGVRRRG